MDEQKKGGALYLIKERGNATNKGRSSGVAGVQELQEFRSSGVQEFRSSGVQEFGSSGVREFQNWRALLGFFASCLFVAALDQHAKSADRRR
jgi:hypothetical protein